MQYGNGNYSYGKRVTLSYIFNGKLCDQMCIFLLLFVFFYDYILQIQVSSFEAPVVLRVF